MRERIVRQAIHGVQEAASLAIEGFWLLVPVLVAAILMAAAGTARASNDGALLVDRELTLKENARTWSQKLCLDDLVEDGWIKSRCAVDKETCCRWTLDGSRERELTRAEIQREISKITFGAFRMTVKGPNTVNIIQTHREIAPHELKAKVVNAAAHFFKEEAINVSADVTRTGAPAYVAFAAESDWDVVLADPYREGGSVRIIEASNPMKTLGWAQASIRLNANVYVATRTIRPTEAVSPGDFELRKTQIMAARAGDAGFVRENSFPDGVRARISIQAGAPLVSAALERIPLVKLGDSVTLILKSDNLRVSTKGVVQGAAGLGDTVSVQLPHYNRTFRGRLVEGKQVEVWL